MKAEQWHRIKRICSEALKRDAIGRAQFLDEACAGDPLLRNEVESLLAQQSAADGFIESPAIEVAARELASAQSGEPEADLTGGTLLHFRIIERIGEGGMGVVYLAEQQHPIRRNVAIKVIRFGMDTKEVVARFESERQALTLMNHPNIARVFDAAATETGRPFFVMEHVPGVSISEYCDRQRLNTRQRLELFIPVCQAIQHAHQKGIIHRDIKPSNVLVTIVDGKPVPKVIDFGLAKAMNQRLTEKSLFTQRGHLVGTPEYMSPEQAEMSAPDVDTTTDIYSLGVMMYELLVGTLPFDRVRLRKVAYDEMCRIIREEEPPTPTRRLSSLGLEARQIAEQRRTDVASLQRQIRGDLDWITMKAMDKDRTRRYRSASELEVDILRHLNEEAVMAGPPHMVYRLRKFVKRRRGLVIAAAAVLLSLMLGLVLSTALYFRSENERQLAERHEKVSRRLLYAAHMTLAQQAWNANNVKRVNQLLGGLRPAVGEEDLRGFEWYYLWRLSHRDSNTIPVDSPITSMAFSPDGRVLTTGSYDGSVGFWNAISWQPIRTFLEHKGAVTSIAFSPTGKIVATGGEDGSVRFWDSPRMQTVDSFKAYSDTIHSIAFSPLGDKLAIAGKDGTVKLWDVARRRECVTLRGHTGAVYAVSFSPDGKILASGGADGALHLWDPTNGRKNVSFQAPSTKITCLSFASGSDWIVAGTEVGIILSWNVTSGKQGAGFEGHKVSVLSLAVTPDGRNLASGSADGSIRVWRFSSRSTSAILATAYNSSPIFSLTFSPDGRRLAAPGMDAEIGRNNLTIWDTALGQELSLPEYDMSRVAKSGWRIDVSTLAYGGDALGVGALVEAFPTTPSRKGPTAMHINFRDVFAARDLVNATVGYMSSIAISRGGKLFASSHAEVAAMRVWDTATGKEVLRLPELEGIRGITAVSLTEQTLAAAGYGTGAKEAQLIKLWDIGTKREVGTLKTKSASIVALQFSPSGKSLAALSRIETRLSRPMYHTCPLGFSPDERTLATDGGDLTLTIWDVRSGQERLTIRDLKGDGRKTPVKSVDLRTGVHGTVLKLWDLTSGKGLGTLEGHDGDINCVTFSQDGKRIVTGGSDGTVKIWDLMTGQVLCTVITDAGIVHAVAFSDDGESLATSGMSRVRIWHAPRTDRAKESQPPR